MPLTPQHRRRAPHAAGNHARANADQTLTEVDTRLTRVDKGCQKLSTVNPRHSRAPLRHTPNNPEQIRTNLNKPEHRQAPRPDRDAPGSPPNSPKKTNPEHRCRPPPPHPRPSPPAPKIRHSCPLLVVPVPSPSFLRRQEPTSPQYSFPAPFPNSSLPPSRGEARWGVEGCERLPTALLHPDRLCLISVAPALSVIPALFSSFLPPLRHSCAGRNPPRPNTPFLLPSPIHPSPLPGGRLGGG